jgi:hypothetical protein
MQASVAVGTAAKYFAQRPVGSPCDNTPMKLQTPLVWAGGALLIALSYHRFGWMGVALVVTGIVFWMMLHFTRMMTVLKRATNAPIGYVASAVMLNAKLKIGVTLLHVTAMTKSLGALQTEKDAQPEVYRWTDTGGSHVTGTFVGGKLIEYVLWRPEQAGEVAAPTSDTARPA